VIRSKPRVRLRGDFARKGARNDEEFKFMRRSNFALRLAPSLMEEARKAADSEGVALNQLINIAVAEKISTLRTVEYFEERARRANRRESLRILARAGKRNPPREGDELPPGWGRAAARRKPVPRGGASPSSRKN
jgi:hypothetical protein